MSPRDRRALAIGGVLVGLAVMGLRVAPWAWRAAGEARAELIARAELLARMQADVASVAELEDSGAVVRERMAGLAPALLTGETDAEASADLASRLGVAAERCGVRVTRTDPVPDTATGSLRRVAIRAELEGDTGGLLDLLQALAAESAVLVVEGLSTAAAEPRVPGDQAEVLRAELTVHGWHLQRAGEP